MAIHIFHTPRFDHGADLCSLKTALYACGWLIDPIELKQTTPFKLAVTPGKAVNGAVCTCASSHMTTECYRRVPDIDYVEIGTSDYTNTDCTINNAIHSALKGTRSGQHRHNNTGLSTTYSTTQCIARR